MTKYLFSVACLLTLAACQSMSPPDSKPLAPSMGTAPATMDNRPVAPPMSPEFTVPDGERIPPDVGSAGPVVGPK